MPGIRSAKLGPFGRIEPPGLFHRHDDGRGLPVLGDRCRLAARGRLDDSRECGLSIARAERFHSYPK
jgi:hypothetical protein